MKGAAYSLLSTHPTPTAPHCQLRLPLFPNKMTLIGSTSRVVAGRKAVQTVYSRAVQKPEPENIKVYKSASHTKSTPNVNLDFSRNSPVWKGIPRGYVPFM